MGRKAALCQCIDTNIWGGGAVELSLLLFAGAVVGYVLFRLARPAGWWAPDRWARAYRIPFNDETGSAITSYVRRTRTLRLVGAAAGFVGPLAYAAVAERTAPGPFGHPLMTVVTGYLLGALVAEASVKRRWPGAVRQASLRPRTVRDYLSPRLTAASRYLAGLSVVVAVLYVVVPLRDQWMSDAAALGSAAGAAALVVLVEALQRAIVRRPQPVTSEDSRCADDAIRSASVHALAAGGIALLLLILGAQLYTLGANVDLQLVRWTLPLLGVACMIAALAAWADISRRGTPSRTRETARP